MRIEFRTRFFTFRSYDHSNPSVYLDDNEEIVDAKITDVSEGDVTFVVVVKKEYS